MKIKLLTILALAALSLQAHAKLTCSGKAYGMSYEYTFTPAADKNLNIHAQIKFDNEIVVNNKGKAIYSSTNVIDFLGPKHEKESYYIYLPKPDEATELISISADLKLMATSSPDPTSDKGNFAKLSCSGRLE